MNEPFNTRQTRHVWICMLPTPFRTRSFNSMKHNSKICCKCNRVQNAREAKILVTDLQHLRLLHEGVLLPDGLVVAIFEQLDLYIVSYPPTQQQHTQE